MQLKSALKLFNNNNIKSNGFPSKRANLIILCKISNGILADDSFV